MASSPIDRNRTPLKASRHRRIGLRFSDVSVLAQRLNKELRHGLLTVPDRRPLPPGERVMVSFSLPGCQRMIEAPTRVESVIDGGPKALGAMVLRMADSAVQLPALFDVFVRDCKGDLCNEAARTGQPVPRCIFISDEATAGSSGNGKQLGVEAEAPESTPTPEQAPRPGSEPSGVFARLTRKAAEFGAGSDGNGKSSRKGKRRSSLLNLRIFSRGAAAAEPEPAAESAPEPAAEPAPEPEPVPRAAPRRRTTREDRQLGLNRSKSALLVGDAARAISAGNKPEARRLLRMALTLDPGNLKAEALLRYVGATGT